MSQETISQRYVLVGPHAGKTLAVNGHEFVDGEYTFVGSAVQVLTLTKIFANYAALPEQEAELKELRAFKAEQEALKTAGVTRAQLEAALLQLPGDQTDPEYVVKAMGSHFGELFTEADEAKVRELVVVKAPVQNQQNRDDTKPTLAEAIAKLDPTNEAHWTSNNLPALEVLGSMVGVDVSRADVNAIADGYTRAKAKAALQQ